MKTRNLLSLAAVAALTVPVFSRMSSAVRGAEIGQIVPQFTVQTTGIHDSQKTKVTTAYVFVGVKCGATPGYVKRIKALEDEFRPKGVDFVYIFPNKTESADEKAAWHEQQGLRGVMVDDQGAKIAKSLGIAQTASVVLCGKDGKILYSGGIDDNKDEAAVQHRFVAEGLNETLAGKPVTTTTSRSFG